MLFSSFINVTAHRIKKVSGLSWGESLKLAIAHHDVPDLNGPTAVFGQWNATTQRALAGHFWALRCLYLEVGDKGRAKAFERVSSQLFSCWECGGEMGWQDTYKFWGWGTAVREEVLDYYISATKCWMRDHTDRVIALLMQTGHPIQRVKLPRWTF